MAKRIYWETVKKWLIKHKISVSSLITGLFIFLVAFNLIDIISHSGDMTCAGTEEDPCYAEITFLAKEDIFIYPIGYDPYGRETLFEFDKPLKDWKFYRSWGSGWRKIDLTKGCTGSWCGCYWCRENVLAKYSYVFRTGRIYTIKIEAYKHNPYEDIKWSFGELDPIWYGIEEEPSWMSPSDWLYVKGEGNTVYTAYGNFTFYGDARVKIEKNGRHYDTIDWYFIVNGNKVNYDVDYEYQCNEIERWCNVTQILSFPDNSEFNITHHFDKLKDKMSLDIYSANERNVTILMHHHLTGFNKYYDGHEVKNIPISQLKEIKNLNISVLKSDVKRMSFRWGKALQYVKSVKFNSTDLLFRTKEIHFSAGQRVHIDPEWTSPTAIESCCEPGGDCADLIDGGSSAWAHSVNENHWVIFDTGSSQTIDQIRIWGDDPDAVFSTHPCSFSEIKVCDDAACDGEDSLGTCGPWTGDSGNNTCDITDTTGQWIKIIIKTYRLSCDANRHIADFREFYYLPAAAVDSTPPTYSTNSTNTTTNATACNFTLQANDETDLTTTGGYIFATNNSGTWENGSYVTFTATPQDMWNVTVLNSTNNTLVQWCFLFNDTAGNYNRSSCDDPFNLTTSAVGVGDTCDCSSIQAGTPIDCSENCDIDACDVGGIDVTFYNTGTIVTNDDVTNIKNTHFSSGCVLVIGTGKRWGS